MRARPRASDVLSERAIYIAELRLSASYGLTALFCRARRQLEPQLTSFLGAAQHHIILYFGEATATTGACQLSFMSLSVISIFVFPLVFIHPSFISAFLVFLYVLSSVPISYMTASLK